MEVTSNYLWGVNRFSSYRLHLLDLIFNMIDEGLIYKDIAKKLNQDNYLSLKGKKFTESIIYKMIKGDVGEKRKQSELVYSDFKIKFFRRT